MTATNERVALHVIRAVADAIRDLGSVPSGHLYAQLMAHMNIQTYDAIISSLKNCRLIQERNHLLTWIGPSEWGA